jgi:hypothetical protein
MSIAKVQHYVPQFLLRKFGTGKKHQLYVYDKQARKAFITNAKNVASESRFYDFNLDGQETTLEPMLSRLEASAKPIIEEILERNSLAFMEPDDRAILSTFFAVQYTRTRVFREQWASVPGLLRKHFDQRGEPAENLTEIADYLRDPTENEIKLETARFLMRRSQEFGAHFDNKTWVLVATTRKRPFLISDNPIALQNMLNFGPLGNLGLAVRGIEIYFPLCPTRALALWCPSHEAALRKSIEDLQRLPGVAPGTGYIHDLLEAIEDGSPLMYKPENVENFNSLQIAWSERFVFSCEEDFSLARQMIAKNPRLRWGPRMTSA